MYPAWNCILWIYQLDSLKDWEQKIFYSIWFFCSLCFQSRPWVVIGCWLPEPSPVRTENTGSAILESVAPSPWLCSLYLASPSPCSREQSPKNRAKEPINDSNSPALPTNVNKKRFNRNQPKSWQFIGIEIEAKAVKTKWRSFVKSGSEVPFHVNTFWDHFSAPLKNSGFMTEIFQVGF